MSLLTCSIILSPIFSFTIYFVNSAIAVGLQKALPQPQELAIGERIFWQARGNGILLAIGQIRQEVAREVSWQEKLSSLDAKYYMKYAESTGKGSSQHEFLKVKDALYRDTLVAIAQNRTIKDQKPLELPELICDLQNEYEQKQRALNYVNAARSFGDDDHYQSHITSLEACGSDRVELYQIMVRDISLLHHWIKGKLHSINFMFSLIFYLINLN